MALATYIPGMEPGKTKRNVALAVVYILLLPVLSLLAPVWVPIYIGTDYNGVAEQLSALPGIEPGGGLKSGAAAFVYIMVATFGPQLMRWLLA